MEFQFSDEKWYAPIEKFTEDSYQNQEQTIFKCRKKVSLSSRSLSLGKGTSRSGVRESTQCPEVEVTRVILFGREGDYGDAKWIRKMLNSGTLTDKLGAMVTLIQNDPVHNMDLIESLLTMANKKGKREAQLSIQSLRELFTLHLLPDRPLRFISQQPLEE